MRIARNDDRVRRSARQSPLMYAVRGALDRFTAGGQNLSLRT